MRKFETTQWVKFACAAILYTLFIVWVGNFWWMLLLPLIFDIYLTKYIPYTWWKKSKNPTVRKIMGWVDAIVFALVAVYFINTFFFQNYQIPTPSLEKSLLVGDFLLVSKCTYGPRIPNTPLSFPLAQHTLPGTTSVKSYIEWPQWDYRRLVGYNPIKQNDIVVFNFPAGDTIALNCQNPDIYSSFYSAGSIQERPDTASLNAPIDLPAYLAQMNRGREVVRSNKAQFGEILWRPVDRRENYVKRCVGMPGDTLSVRECQLYINSRPANNPKGMQYNYFIQVSGGDFTEEFFLKEGIAKEDIMTFEDARLASFLGLNADQTGSFGKLYLFPLTMAMKAKLEKIPFVKKVMRQPSDLFQGGTVYPLAYSNRWTSDNYGPIWIPKRGATIPLTEDNYIRYERAIRDYEQNKLEYTNGQILLNGKPATTYTFKMDYYFMMGDNRHNSADSRAWGFVPEDHIVGKPVLVWLSLNKDKGWFSGKIRFNRMFRFVDAL